ncbi:Zn-dependent hydrolase [Shimia sp. NS0008-38b]|uniref:hydantoinase/carbamoylase family amidase n=1 Tax=Shimia sp. NS0008-38b TaxID=3127653 RepID=UPI0031084ED1
MLNPERFLKDLHTLRSFGASGVGKGVKRRAYSDADIASREWLASQFEAAGLKSHFDPVGSVWGLSGEHSLLLGSHSDTQPEGGWLDGALGVVAALEIARANQETGGPPVSVVSFQDEEGRFGGTTGSAIWAQLLPLEEADKITDTDGVSLAKARGSMTHLDNGWIDPAQFTGYLEMHIEQGPWLDKAKQTIGIVTEIVGIRELKIVFHGAQNHAGTTPMSMRSDAFQMLSTFNQTLNLALKDVADDKSVWTIGHVRLHPGASSVVPGTAEFMIQWRDGSAKRLDEMEAQVRKTSIACAEDFHGTVELIEQWSIPPTKMSSRFQNAMEYAAKQLSPGAYSMMPSGALHDASNVARLMPAGMLFVPSINGISHAFEEDTSEADLVKGLQVLAATIATLAN